MKITLYHTKLILFFIASVLIITACRKSPDQPAGPIDPATGLPPVTLTTGGGECLLVKIAQKNSATGKSDNVFTITRDVTLIPTTISLYDSLLGKTDYNTQLQTTGDTIRLSTGEYFVTGKLTKLVDYFFTRSDLADPKSDAQVYQYFYNTDGYLIKKLQFVNGASLPYYETNYIYNSNNLLVNCIVYAGSKKDVLLQTTLSYDMASAKKPWMYLFPDFFNGYQYLQALPFGKRGNYPVKDIVTTIYDITDASVLDIWSTNFSGYVYSQDGFILQTTAKGDLQQGLGLLFGTTRFDYQCSK